MRWRSGLPERGGWAVVKGRVADAECGRSWNVGAGGERRQADAVSGARPDAQVGEGGQRELSRVGRDWPGRKDRPDGERARANTAHRAHQTLRVLSPGLGLLGACSCSRLLQLLLLLSGDKDGVRYRVRNPLCAAETIEHRGWGRRGREGNKAEQ